MTHPSESTPPSLPPELAELDAELAAIRIEERPSFGPELEAELARAWAERPWKRAPSRRRAVAAAIAGLLIVAVAVPPARASLVRLVGAIQRGATARPTAPSPLLAPTFDATPPVVAPSRETEPDATPRENPRPSPEPAATYEGAAATFPEMLDRQYEKDLVRSHYPPDLQQAGIGGTVRLVLWVDSAGGVEFVHLRRGSGIAELDHAAMEVAPSFRFSPARRMGQPVGTWVEFDVTFAPPEPDAHDRPPVVEPVDLPEVDDVLNLDLVPAWRGEVFVPSPVEREAVDLLEQSLGGPGVVRELGPLRAILRGEAPPGVAPTRWRSEVSDALEEALTRDPDNPAPLLALARIRRRQGLRTEARILLEKGLQRARRGPVVSRSLLAELHYERGDLLKEDWLVHRDLGRVRAVDLPEGGCPRARSSGGSGSGYASVERLTAWNYLCPEVLETVFQRSFLPEQRGPDVDRQVMLASLRTAVDARPAHVEANVQLLLALADEGRWKDMLTGARRFVWASRGHPYGLLLSGLALQRLSRSEEAMDHFRLALRGLPEDQQQRLLDITPLTTPAQENAIRHLDPAVRARWTEVFWTQLDPILSTDVNERKVEHLARSSYAELRFGAVDSDPGKVWVRYGRPAAVRVLGDGRGQRTEFWDYGQGPDITFRRASTSDEMDLTPEGRAYVDELRQVFPQRYGTGSRLVFSLPGQLGRFRGAAPGTTDLAFYTSVPPMLATGASDTLDLGVFLLDRDGRKLATTRSRIPAVEKSVSFQAPVGSSVSRMVVEFYHAREARAAAVREAVKPIESPATGSISDLLITEPSAPSGRTVHRRDAWIAPLTLDRPVPAGAVGVFFELYDLASHTSWYRVRAEAVDRDTGAIRSLPTRPAGEEGFRPTWDRQVPSEGRDTEYLTVALSDVPPGRYTLEVTVDIPGAAAPLVARRDLAVR